MTPFMTFTKEEIMHMECIAVNRGWITFMDGKWVYRRGQGDLESPIGDIKKWLLSRLVMQGTAVPVFEYAFDHSHNLYRVFINH